MTDQVSGKFMIDSRSNPVEWATLVYELDDAKDHLATLISEMQSQGIDEEAYRVQLGHVFAGILGIKSGITVSVSELS